MVNKKLYIRFILLCFFIGFFPNASQAADRPKIGLVLGGGGARGAAHIGVLKVLEENNVPIDFIVGTSMGSIVGGLYAAGYSPDEIDTIIRDIDWVDMFSDRPSESMLSFRNKKDYVRLAVFEMGIKDGKITFPEGIVAGQKLGFMLQKLTLHTVGLNHFDQLRIPFRAVATDAVTGNKVVFEKGNLAEAIRSSMSVPGAFPPVRRGEEILIDGMVVNNVPVEIAKEAGMDVLITVNVGGGLLKAEQLNNFLSVTGQMVNILVQQNVDKSLSLLTDKDVYIQPDLGNMSSGDFVDAPQAIDKGEASAQKSVEEIKRYSVDKNEFEHFLVRQRKSDLELPMIDFIEVKNPKRVHPQQVKGRINTKVGEPLNLDTLQGDLTRILALGDFTAVSYDIIEKNGKKGLIIDAPEKPWGPNYLRFGLNFESSTGGSNDYTMILDYRRRQVNKFGGEWKTIASLGQSSGVFSEFYQPLDPENYFFIAPYALYQSNIIDLYEGEDRIAKYGVDEYGGGFDIGVNARSYVETRFGIRATKLKADVDTGSVTLPEFDGIARIGFQASVDYDQLDDHKFPSSGSKAYIKYYHSEKGMGADDKYTKIDYVLGKAITFKDRHTFLAILKGGISPDDDVPFYDRFRQGGFLNLSGLAKDQLRNKNTGLAQLIYFNKLVHTQGFASKIYVGGSIEAGNAWDEFENYGDDLIVGGSLFLGVDTVLGPLYLGYGKAESNKGHVYLFLGKSF